MSSVIQFRPGFRTKQNRQLLGPHIFRGPQQEGRPLSLVERGKKLYKKAVINQWHKLKTNFYEKKIRKKVQEEVPRPSRQIHLGRIMTVAQILIRFKSGSEFDLGQVKIALESTMTFWHKYLNNSVFFFSCIFFCRPHKARIKMQGL